MDSVDQSSFRVESPIGCINVVRRGRRWYARKRIAGKMLWIALRTTQREVASARAYRYIADRAGEKAAVLDRRRISDVVYADMYKRAVARAKKSGFDIAQMISLLEILSIAAAQNHCCALTDIPFSTTGKGVAFRAPYAPSLDRIDARRGYVQGNVRIVCTAVNWALSDWGDEVLDRVCHGYVGRTERIDRMVKPARGV